STTRVTSGWPSHERRRGDAPSVGIRTGKVVAHESQTRPVDRILERAVLLQPFRAGVRTAELDDAAAVPQQSHATHRRLYALPQSADRVRNPHPGLRFGSVVQRLLSHAGQA